MKATVLVFSGLDPSGGAGMAADVAAIGAMGAHALPLVTALTVQDHNHVHEVVPVESGLLARQAALLAHSCRIGAVKIGIPGNRANAEVIAALIRHLREGQPDLSVVLDPVLASGHGDALGQGDAAAALAPLLPLASVVLPNLGEAEALDLSGCRHVLLTGGHGTGPQVVNRWRSAENGKSWHWPRLAGAFHGSGCTLAAALAACLAQGQGMAQALERAQVYTHDTLAEAFAVGPGQLLPQRFLHPY